MGHMFNNKPRLFSKGQRQEAALAALGELGAALLKAGGPSPFPTNMGAAFGAFGKGYRSNLADQSMTESKQLKQQLAQAQLQEFGQKQHGQQNLMRGLGALPNQWTDPDTNRKFGEVDMTKPGGRAQMGRLLAGAGNMTSAVKMMTQEPPPSGFQNTEGGLSFIPGGPADPTYQGNLTQAKTPNVPQYSGKVLFDQKVGKYYQTNPKTQKREYVSPKDEWKLEADGQGGFTFTKGSKASGGLQKSTRGFLEKKLIAANEGYERLKSLKASFKPEYQELGTRWNALVTGLKAKIKGGESVDPKDRKLLIEYATHRRESFAFLNQYIKDITGAQVSAQEAVRIMKAVPNPGTSLLGGDDPITYQAKLDSAMRDLEKAKIRYAYYLKKGITNVKEMASRQPLGTMQIHVNQTTGGRGVVIEGEWVQL